MSILHHAHIYFAHCLFTNELVSPSGAQSPALSVSKQKFKPESTYPGNAR